MRPRKCVQGLGIERAPALSLPKADVQLCSARERESWGASERPDAVTARLPVVGGEEEDKEDERN